MAATIVLIGNLNCGKTTIFNGLTGANQRVGNWPGVTVERKEGSYWDRDLTVTVVDLPGVYALDAEESGLDEQIARKFLLAREYDLVVNILDAANLERNFYLTSQLLDLGVPLLLDPQHDGCSPCRKNQHSYRDAEPTFKPSCVALLCQTKTVFSATAAGNSHCLESSPPYPQ